MTYDYREKKIVAVLNEELTSGQALNALGHIAVSAGRYAGDIMGKEKIIDTDGNVHTGISRYPFIVLKASKERIKQIVKAGKEKGLFVVDYPQEMFDTGPDDELVVALSKAKEPDIIYHGIIIVGPTKEISKLTGDLKLWR
ncbi:MAG: DUF2000 family protein [Candidatus Aenigmarchaeota archaeon]|nr:DUF2000 family protein [Candidatus Aenigmarchaeota archaeon]